MYLHRGLPGSPLHVSVVLADAARLPVASPAAVVPHGPGWLHLPARCQQGLRAPGLPPQVGPPADAVTSANADQAEVAQRAVVEFMRDWNAMPPDECAWRMFARLKVSLSRMEADLPGQVEDATRCTKWSLHPPERCTK